MSNKWYEKIVELRKEKSMTQGDLADKLSISRATVASWETGRREPDMDTFVKLGKIFNVTVDYITGKVSDELSKEELYWRNYC